MSLIERFLKEFNSIVLGILYFQNIEAMEAIDDFKVDYLGLDAILKSLMYFSPDDSYFFDTEKGKID